MYVKLAIRNARKSMKDYLIYMVTLIICVGLFYSFMSICSQYYVSHLSVEYNLKVTQKLMKYPIAAITALLIFLIKYVNQYILIRKQKEFAIQTLLGMEQRNAALLFFVETLIMGLISIGAGLVLGAFLSQFLTYSVMNFFQEEYRMYFSLFPDTVLITVAGFCVAFILIGFFNIRKIRKMKIIDMLHADKELQNDMKKEYLMPVITLLAAAIGVKRSCSMILQYKMGRETDIFTQMKLADTISYWCNLILPILFLGVVTVTIISCFVKRKVISMKKPVIALTGLTILSILFELMIVAGHPVLDTASVNEAYLYVIIHLVYLMSTIFYSFSVLMQIFRSKSRSLKYKGNTLFVLGQLNARLSSNSRSMSILAGTILLALTTFIVDPILSGWALGYIEERAVYDIQINSDSNSETKIEAMPDGNFTYVESVLQDMDIRLKDQRQVSFYLTGDSSVTADNQTQRNMVMKLSDYNYLRKMAGLDQIRLGEDEFTIQWHYSAQEEEIDRFIEQNTTLTIKGRSLQEAKQARYRAKLGEVIYPGFDTKVVIVPDAVCNGLVAGKCNFYGNAAEKMSFEKATGLYETLQKHIRALNKEKEYNTQLRLRTLQRNEGISGALSFKLLLFYGGIVLFVISFTVLSLQQLADSYDFKQRFKIIRKMGVSDASVHRMIGAQMGIWFGLPILFAGISAVITGSFYIRWSGIYINMLIGREAFRKNLLEMMLMIASLFISYFISTWVIFKKNIES